MDTEEPPAPVATTVALSPAALTFSSLGETGELVAAVADQSGAPMSGVPVTWSSSAASVASVASGVVTAVADGTATITATAGSTTGSASVTVGQVAATVTLSPDPLVLDAPGEAASVTASALDAGGSPMSSPALAWSSDDEGVATVSDAGLVTGVSAGTTSVTASAEGGAASEVAVTVHPALVITTSALVGGVVSESYSETLTATGGDDQYSWALSSGSLPDGLMLGSDGEITGTPTMEGTFDFVVEASSLSQTTEAPLSITIDPHAHFSLTYQDSGGETRHGRIDITDDGTDFIWSVEVEGPDLVGGRLAATVYDPRTVVPVDDGFVLRPLDAAGPWIDIGPTCAAGSFGLDASCGGTVDGGGSEAVGSGGLTMDATKPLDSGDPWDASLTEGDTVHIFFWMLLYEDFFGQGPFPRWTVYCTGQAVEAGTALPSYVVGAGLEEPGECEVAERSWDMTVGGSLQPSQPADPTVVGVGQTYVSVIRASHVARPAEWVVTGLPPGIAANAYDGDPDARWLEGEPTTPGDWTVTVTITDARGQVVTQDYVITVTP